MRSPTTHVSRTALTIALSAVATAHDPRRASLVDADAEALASAALSAEGRRLQLARRLMHRTAPRVVLRALERALLPGLQLHFRARKRLIERHVEQALAGGVRQLVVLGAGFDALALRMAKAHHGVQCLEIDRAVTQERKRAAVAAFDAPPKNLRFTASDLEAQPLGLTLAAAGVDLGAPLVVVAEGLLMYLPEATVRRLLADFGREAARGSQLVLTAMDRRADGRAGFHRASRLVRSWLRVQREPFRWGMARDELTALVSASGLTVRRVFDHTDEGCEIHAVLGRVERPAAGETIVIAERV